MRPRDPVRAGQGGVRPRVIPTAAGKPDPVRTARPVEGGLHGTVVVGGLMLAVPIGAIREVVPRPRTLLPFPAARDEVIGAIELRGAIVPVLDPVRLLRVPDPGACPVVLILRHADRVIGLAIEAIASVLPLDVADLTLVDMAGGDGAGEAGSRSTPMRAAFVHGDARGMILDTEALANLDAMPLARERRMPPALAGMAKNGVATNGVPTLLFTTRSVRLGLAAWVIEASVPDQPITPSPIRDALWIGSLTHNGRRIPVIDTLKLLRLGECRRSGRAAAVIVRLASGDLVGLQIDAVTDMRRILPDAITRLQGFAVGNHALCSGLYEGNAPSLVLDPEAVRVEEGLAIVGRLSEQTQAAADDAKVQRDAVRAFLLVRLRDRRFAIALDQVEEIIATRASGIGLTDHAQAITDFIIHRGRGVPLIDLPLALGLTRTAVIAPFTVLASADGNQAGFMVDELCAVERAPVQLLRDVGSDRTIGRIAATISTAGHTYPVIDLRSLIGALCTPAEAA